MFAVLAAFILSSCQVTDPVTNSGDTNTNSGGDTNTNSGDGNNNPNNAAVYSDSANYSLYSNIPLSLVGGFSDNTNTLHRLTETSNGNNGANGSTKYYSIEITDSASDYGGAMFEFTNNAFNAAAISDMHLKFSIRTINATNAMGQASIGMRLVKPGNPDNPETQTLPTTLTTTTNWQEVSYGVTDYLFPGDHSTWVSNIIKIVIAVADVNGSAAGVGAQTLDIDEIRFEVVSNSAASAVATARDALQIVFLGANNNASNVTTDVRLPIHDVSYNGVRIVWGSSLPNVINPAGMLGLPRQANDTVVTLTATLTKGSTSIVKTFALTASGTSN